MHGPEEKLMSEPDVEAEGSSYTRRDGTLCDMETCLQLQHCHGDVM